MSGDSTPAFADECFFIAPIGDEESDVRKRSDGVMTYIVQKAVDKFNLRTVRADQIATPGLINLQVINHVLGARAAVADLTGQNPNVFYEMAIRHTARLPLVIIAEKGTPLPFDILQMRTIFFDHTDLADADRCRSQVQAQLEEALTNGVVESPISTAINLRALSSGSPADRTIADLVTAVESLISGQREVASGLEDLRGGQGPYLSLFVFRDLIGAIDEVERLAKDEATSPGAFGPVLGRLKGIGYHLQRFIDPSVFQRTDPDA